MNVLVLGGCGFIGSHVVDKLLASGYIVRVFDKFYEKYRKPLDGVDYRIASFDDAEALSCALIDIDIVYHFISTTVPSSSNDDPLSDIESNLKCTVRLLGLMKDLNVQRIVYLSSGGTVYGLPEVAPIHESHPLRPICSYGIVKVAIENYLYMYHQLYGINYVILRASNPYGERQGHTGIQGVIGTFLNKVLISSPLDIWGDGSVIRDFLYVEDLAELCISAGQSNVNGIFNAGSGAGVTINKIVEVINEVSGYSSEIIYRERRGYDVPRVILDITQAKSVFGWRPVLTITQGVERTWSWMKEESK